jgi:hypothetical protein
MKRLSLALFALAAAAGAADAVVVNPRGQGQALIFPYYTTAAGNSSVLTLTNQSPQAKIVRIRFAEGENGRTAAQLDVYLGLYDTWTAALFARGDGEAPGLLTTDNSCTNPPIATSTSLPQLPDGRRYLPLGPAITDDAGSDAPQRLREGFVEALELASIRRPSPTYFSIVPATNGRPGDCAAVIAASTPPSGYWIAEPLRDLANPTGGLSGEISVVDVAAGIVFATSAVALEDYRSDPLDRPRGTTASVALNGALSGPASLLGHALNDPAARIARARVLVGGETLSLSYPAPERAIDAVSAVLTATELFGTYEETPALGAHTSFVLTYPTRPLYTDAAQSGAAQPLAPFTRAFAGVRPPAAADATGFVLYDRDALMLRFLIPGPGCGFPCPPHPPVVRLPGTAVEVLALGATSDPLLGTRLPGDIGFQQSDGGRYVADGAGHLRLILHQSLSSTTPALSRPSLEGHRLSGLPVLGLRLINYVNANAAPGLLANYSSALPMTADVRCVDAAGQPCVP